MKNLALTVLLALLVVLTAVSLRRAVSGTVAAADNPGLLAIGTDPVPPMLPGPPPKPSNLKPSNASWSLAIGTDPVPPMPPGPPPKPSNLKPGDAAWLLAIGTDPVPPMPPGPPSKPKN